MLSIKIRRIALASTITFLLLMVLGQMSFEAMLSASDTCAKNGCDLIPLGYLGMVVIIAYSIPIKLIEIFVDKKPRKSGVTKESNPIYLLFAMILIFFTFWLLSNGIELNTTDLVQLAGLSILGNILFELVWNSISKQT